MRAASPLRYPGGKWRISPFLERLISINGLNGHEYVEPYAGGASLALSLLLNGTVSQIHLNDLDPAIYSFWWAVLRKSDALVRLIDESPLTVSEWERQRGIYSLGTKAGRLALGFATFYLNRTNHSGIMNGGVIGGKSQTGPWRIDARFNRPELKRRIKQIAERGNTIRIYHQDALAFLEKHPFARKSIIYLDPPYFKHGKALYLNAYDTADHECVQNAVRKLSHPWLISYDDVPDIRRLYCGLPSRRITLLHTARSLRVGREIMFFSETMKIPRISTHYAG